MSEAWNRQQMLSVNSGGKVDNGVCVCVATKDADSVNASGSSVVGNSKLTPLPQKPDTESRATATMVTPYGKDTVPLVLLVNGWSVG